MAAAEGPSSPVAETAAAAAAAVDDDNEAGPKGARSRTSPPWRSSRSKGARRGAGPWLSTRFAAAAAAEVEVVVAADVRSLLSPPRSSKSSSSMRSDRRCRFHLYRLPPPVSRCLGQPVERAEPAGAAIFGLLLRRWGLRQSERSLPSHRRRASERKNEGRKNSRSRDEKKNIFCFIQGKSINACYFFNFKSHFKPTRAKKRRLQK